MKKKILALMALVTLGIQAQDYNKWFVDLNGGFNKPVTEMSNGYSTSTPSFWTVDGGVRYMFNNKVGLRLGAGYDSYKNTDSSKAFESNLWNINLQGYANVGRVLEFEKWTSDLGLLAHAGFGYGRLNSDYLSGTDQVAFGVAGLTPQLRITDRITFFGDASVYLNGRQNRTFDTYTETSRRGIQGIKFTATVGLSFALGIDLKSADWYYEASRIGLIEARVANLEDKINNLDKNVKSLVFADSNSNGVPDNVETFLKNNYNTDKKVNLEDISADAAKSLIEKGYISLYFNFNSAELQSTSVWAVDFIVKYLKSNPGSSVVAVGFADELGNEDYNQRLSEKRANVVRDLLVKAGVDATRIFTDAKGEDKSVDKSSSDARQIARRVTFRLK